MVEISPSHHVFNFFFFSFAGIDWIVGLAGFPRSRLQASLGGDHGGAGGDAMTTGPMGSAANGVGVLSEGDHFVGFVVVVVVVVD